jgi:hypothetical protein
MSGVAGNPLCYREDNQNNHSSPGCILLALAE